MARCAVMATMMAIGGNGERQTAMSSVLDTSEGYRDSKDNMVGYEIDDTPDPNPFAFEPNSRIQVSYVEHLLASWVLQGSPWNCFHSGISFKCVANAWLT